MDVERTPVILWADRSPAPAETYGFASSSGVVLEGQLLKPAGGGGRERTVYVADCETAGLWAFDVEAQALIAIDTAFGLIERRVEYFASSRS